VTRQARIVRALWLATTLGSVVLVILVATLMDEVDGEPELTALFAMLGFDAFAFASMAALIERRRPGNRVALVLAATGPLLVLTFCGFAVGALRYESHGPDDLLGGLFATIGGSTLGPALFVAVPTLAVLFPDGLLPGPRWRVPFGTALGAVIAASVVFLVQPGPVNTGLPDNPFGIESEVVVALGAIAAPLLSLAILAGSALAVAAVATRFRRSHGLERQQVKWLLGAVTVILITLPASFVDGNGDAGFTLLDAIAVSSLALLPISVGIAITRYRLYEIDRLISRTIGWALVTGILVAVFALLVVGLQAVLSPVTEENTLAVAASTLLAASLFQPLRVRVQRAVDRRFNRSRVNADDTVASFAAHVRNEVDLVRLRTALVATAHEAVRPAGSAIWLRGPRGASR
jgi:hypothetical protein